jgi:PRTRC genetic system protein C
MKIENLARKYRYEGNDLPVPEHLAGDENALKVFHAALYPAIVTAEAVEVGVENGAYVIEYRRTVGTKGQG